MRIIWNMELILPSRATKFNLVLIFECLLPGVWAFRIPNIQIYNTLKKNPIMNKLLSSESKHNRDIEHRNCSMHCMPISSFVLLFCFWCTLDSIFASRLRLLIYAIKAHAAIQYKNRIEVNTVYCILCVHGIVLYIVWLLCIHYSMMNSFFCSQIYIDSHI